MDTLIRRRQMIASGASPATTMIPYIRGGGNGSYIDTGITPDSTTRVIVWARNWNPSARMLFGSNDSSQHFWISAHNSARVGQIGVAYGAWASPYNFSDDVFSKLSGYHKYELYQGVLKIDGVAIYTNSNSFTGNSNNIYLFGRNNSGALDGLVLPADICACQIYKNGVLVRDYSAVNSPSVGLYDAVSDTVFTNAGTDSFAYGKFNPDAYTPLEYISCSRAQYFDTGLKGGYSVPWVLVFTPEGTEAGFYYPIGARTSTSSGKCAVGVGNSTYLNGRLMFHYQAGDNAVKSTNTNNYFTNKKIVYVKQNNVATAYINNTQEGTVTGTSGTSFETEYNLFIGAMNTEGSGVTGRHDGKLYYCGIGTYRNYVPAKVNGVAGMYDTYNDVFKPSMTETGFIAGTEL